MRRVRRGRDARGSGWSLDRIYHLRLGFDVQRHLQATSHIFTLLRVNIGTRGPRAAATVPPDDLHPRSGPAGSLYAAPSPQSPPLPFRALDHVPRGNRDDPAASTVPSDRDHAPRRWLAYIARRKEEPRRASRRRRRRPGQDEALRRRIQRLHATRGRPPHPGLRVHRTTTNTTFRN